MLGLNEILLIISAYLLGSISSAVIICRLFSLPDPRTLGSNNPGATNVLRTGNKKAAALTLLFDTLKGFLTVLLAYFLNMGLLIASLVLMATFLGHVYPIWFGFKGGKGVATFLGGMLALSPMVGVMSALTWLLVAKGLKISSLAALVMVGLTPVYFYFYQQDLPSTAIIIILSIWIFWTHRNNIMRLFNQEESTL